MKERLTTTKVTPAALRLIRLIAAATGRKQYAAVERILETEADRLGIRAAR